MGRGRLWLAAASAALIGVAGCALPPPRTPPGDTAPPAVRPEARPAPKPAALPAPSEASAALTLYYRRLQADLLTRGLLRTDGGGVDTPFSSEMLVRNFEAIALRDEYQSGAGLTAASGAPVPLKKWVQPVRIAAEFGPSVARNKRETDMARLTAYTARLARITGHPVALSEAAPNVHVLFMGEDDRALIRPRVQALVPGIDRASLALLENLPRSIQCLVIAFEDAPGSHAYGQAIALIRAELPDLLRRSCIHEELAQGLGLANDSPFARPSIFNDDEEFALLTTHDEMLLRILYSPRLSPGMTAETARPIVRDLANALAGGPS